MAAMRRTKLVEFFWRVHPAVYRATGGRILGRVLGMPVLLLTTRGRRSGAPRTTALTYHPAPGGYVVIGSFLGEPRDPAWVHNLRSQPRAEVQIGRRHIPVIAREVRGSEREKLWSDVVGREPSYAVYAERTERRIPVVVLEPADGAGHGAVGAGVAE
jgi:deazaflavin-dependent oxidoreductase (nitroreductase family)